MNSKGKNRNSTGNIETLDKYASRRNVTEKFVDEALASVKANILDTITLEINKSIDSLKESLIQNLVEENRKLKKRVNVLEDEVDDLYDRMLTLEADVNEQQQRSRRNNLEIHGIPNEILDENLEKATINILNNIVNDPISPEEVDACHRLPGAGKSKPVIMRFIYRKRRDELVSNGPQLNDQIIKENLGRFGIHGNKLYVNENLSPNFKSLTYHCRCLKRSGEIKKWIYDNGKLKIKVLDHGKWVKIRHEEDITAIFPKYKLYDG